MHFLIIPFEADSGVEIFRDALIRVTQTSCKKMIVIIRESKIGVILNNVDDPYLKNCINVQKVNIILGEMLCMTYFCISFFIT